MKQPLSVATGKKIRLREFDADYTGGRKRDKKTQAELAKNVAELDDLGYRLYAENRRSLLLVLQGMDTAGKDGTIRHVMQGFNPQSCQVASFKQPGVEELAHDFLWRIYRAAPRKGFIGIAGCVIAGLILLPVALNTVIDRFSSGGSRGGEEPPPTG